MRIDEVLARGGGPVVSFEFLPPRSVEAELALWTAIEELAALEPAFVSVTYGAGGSTREMTLAVVRRLAGERRLEAVPHLTAVATDRFEQAALLDAVVAGGADNVLVLRGDPPRDGGRPATSAEALALARMAAERGLCVIGACYPEPHPDSRGWAADLDWLRAKLDAGVRVFITQLFLDNADYLRFVERADLGVPVIPGIVPIAGIAQLERMVSLCSASVPRRLRRELEARQDDPRAVADLGVAYATAQCAELLEAGAPGVHLYTRNRSPATRAIVSALRASGKLRARAAPADA